MRKLWAVLSACAVVLGSSALSTSAHAQQEARPAFEETVHIYLPGLPVTLYEFTMNCPAAPLTQGLTGHVFEIPSHLRNRRDVTLQVETTAHTVLGGTNLFYFSPTCELIGSELVDATAIPLPTEAAFIEVSNYTGINYDLTFRLFEPVLEDLGYLPPVKPPKGRLKPWVAQGHVIGPSLPPVTWYEFFLTTCPQMPSTQGVTGMVLELPDYLKGQPGLGATVVTAGTVPGYEGTLELVFISGSCDSLGTDSSPAPVPRGTAFVIVGSLTQANFDFELTIEQQNRSRP